jgi:CP family cyanate transporter-like MFS transporter
MSVPEPASRGLTDRRMSPAVLALAVVLLAVNLRTTVASLPPLLGQIEDDLGLSGAAAGLLTALPVLCMAWFAPTAHRLAHRFGSEATALAAAGLVAVGNGLRLGGSQVLALYGGTLVAGLGVAICGVVLPRIVKELFPGRTGAATGAYTVSMMLGAAIAASLAVPLDHLLGSWQASLASWALPALVAVLAWVPISARLNEREPEAESHPGRLPWTSRPAWLLAVFLSLQSSLAYAVLGWLAPAYEARGWSDEAAGALLGAQSVAQLSAALLLPALADRTRDRRAMLLAAVGCTVVGTCWLLALPDTLPWVASSVLGFGLGGGFSLGLVVIVDYAANTGAASRLTAMVFLVSYTAAALAPVVVGVLRDATDGFTASFAFLVLLAVGQFTVATRLSPAYRASVP